ncbi:sensor histidine kinase [Hathewaya limosa]|uniref:histidine kinase n=1 Tax=Hathewaya limosa TaxID=1536 RepID=A0ABU0JPU4_HATLI|nr:ATP-binding protein [Hathewaya limosa]MDQ0478301.1 signal transduction histidine kinase [Hathewaya limosa]
MNLNDNENIKHEEMTKNHENIESNIREDIHKKEEGGKKQDTVKYSWRDKRKFKKEQKKLKRKNKINVRKEKLRQILKNVQEQIKTSLRMEVLAITIICLLISVFSYYFVDRNLKNKISKNVTISFKEERENLDREVRTTLGELMYFKQGIDSFGRENQEEFKKIIEGTYNNKKRQINLSIEQLKEFIVSQYSVNHDDINDEEIRKIIQNSSSVENAIEEVKKYISSDTLNNIRINEILNRSLGNGNVYLTDLDGNIKFKGSNTFVDKINVYGFINKLYSSDNEEANQYYAFYPVKILNSNYYLMYDNSLHGTEVVFYTSESKFFASIVAFVVFIILFLLATKKKIQYIEYISKSLREISKGNLDYKVNIEGKDELAIVAYDINYMEEQIKDKIEKERRAEKTKNELITNVSHDLRTPLTSVMGYIGLVKEGRYENEKQREEYLNIAYNKAEKLKVLIEDLFAFTKMNNKGAQLNKNNIAINELIRQLIVELEPICEEKNIVIDDKMKKSNIMLEVDGDKISRVFENILSNAIKYSSPKEKIEINIEDDEKYCIVSISNKCYDISKDELDKLFNRFYRSDKSRNSSTGGSGLGLAIAKSIVEAHNGEIWASYEDDRIFFNVRLYK